MWKSTQLCPQPDLGFYKLDSAQTGSQACSVHRHIFVTILVKFGSFLAGLAFPLNSMQAVNKRVVGINLSQCGRILKLDLCVCT